MPGEFGERVTVKKENTTLYASDRDMFVFLADEENRIEIPGRRAGRSGSFARGFFVWNSEVGKKRSCDVEETVASSFSEVVLAIFVRGSDSNAAARQCLPKKYLDFGIDAP